MGQVGEATFAGLLFLTGGLAGDRIALAENSAAVQDAQDLAADLDRVVQDNPDGRFYDDDALTVLRVMATADTLTMEDTIQVSRTGDTVSVHADMPAPELQALAADHVSDAEATQNGQRWLYRGLGGTATLAAGEGLRAAGKALF